MVWTALQRYSTMFVQFISGIILARLLTPYDYGCIGMLSIFMALAEVFIDGGFGSALIQKKRPTKEDYSTIFFWNIFMSVVMYVILYVTAPAIARFYNIPLLSKVLRVQALVLFIYAFNIIQKNQLKKKLNFKVISIVTITTSIISLGVTILLAYKGFGVWALVAQNLITAAIPTVVFWFALKWRPILTFSWTSFKELFGFGVYMFLTHIINEVSNHLQGLLIGRLYSASDMGYYSKARSTEKLASHSISQVMTQVTYPLYAEVQDNKERLIGMIKGLTSSISYVTFPLMYLLLLLAEPIFIFLYSDRWADSVPFFQVLCIAGLAGCLQSVNLQSISAIGKSRTMFIWTVIKRTIGMSFVVGGLLLWGIKGLLWGCVVNAWFAYFVNIALVSKHIGYKWYTQLKDLFPTFTASTLVAAICLLVGKWLDLSMYADGALKLSLYVALYLGWSVIAKPSTYLLIKSRLIKRGKAKNQVSTKSN